MARAAALQAAAVDLARASGEVDPGTLDAHLEAVAAGRRALVVQVGISGGRLAVSCWSAAVDRGADPAPLPLLNLSQRRER
jgi:hypothetical protein